MSKASCFSFCFPYGEKKQEVECKFGSYVNIFVTEHIQDNNSKRKEKAKEYTSNNVPDWLRDQSSYYTLLNRNQLVRHTTDIL